MLATQKKILLISVELHENILLLGSVNLIVKHNYLMKLCNFGILIFDGEVQLKTGLKIILF